MLAVLLIVAGSSLAAFIQTSGGRVEVKSVQFEGAGGQVYHARLYVPDGVSAENPAPAILATHGYINTNETQSPFAIEFSRRGYVVLAPDQPGHGYSAPPAFANALGGLDTLTYLRALDFVDPDNIGLEGHSMGGWSSLFAAATHPDGYRSMVLEGSSTGTLGAPEGTAEFPRNVAVVFSKYDEFSGLMWNTPRASDIAASDKLKTLFGTQEPVVPGQLYGSIQDGTARILLQPSTTHPGDHFSNQAIGHAIDWFDQTLDGAKPLPVSNQVWIWKELGTLIALIGMVMLLVPAGSILLRLPSFQSLKTSPESSAGLTGRGWWGGAVLFMILPILTYFPLRIVPELAGWKASAIFGQEVTTTLIFWTTITGAISLLLFTAWHRLSNRKTGATLANYGAVWSDGGLAKKVGLSTLLAIGVAATAYLSLVLVAATLGVDFRIWVFGVKPLSLLQARVALSYLVPFTAFFLVTALALHGQLRRPDWSFRRELGVNWLLLAGPWLLLLALQYIPLLTDGTLALAIFPLFTIIAIQFVPLMTIAAIVFTGLYRLTGRIYAGAFVNGLLFTWIVVASQATHFAY